MTVEKNVTYGVPKGTIQRNKTLAVSGVLEMLKIEHLKNRYPGQISGGKKQRVALARASKVAKSMADAVHFSYPRSTRV